MKRFLFVSPIMALSMLCVPFVAAPVRAQDRCGRLVKVAADSAQRDIRAEKFGFSFKIPQNYRTSASGSGKTQYIQVFDPGLYDYLQCLKRNRLGTEGFMQTLSVQMTPTDGAYETATDFLNGTAPPRMINVVKNIRVGDQPAILAVQDIAGIFTVAKVVVLSPDKQVAISIAAAYNGEPGNGYDPSRVVALNDLITVVNSLKFGNSAAAPPPANQPSVAASQVAPTLRALVPQIRASLPPGMMMRLPTEIEGIAYDGSTFPIYGMILPRDDDQFTIRLAQTPDCEVRVCMVGYIAVAPRNSQSLPTRGEKTEAVNITSTIRGRYVYLTFPGAASLPPVNVVVWEQDGFAYVVSSSMTKQKVLEIAKSMANGAVIQSQR